MPLLKLEPFPIFSPKSIDKNRWADFLELLCLINSDKEVSLNDIITMYTQEELSGISNGDENHSEKVDVIRANFIEIFRYIFSRMDYLDEFYPFFKVDEDTIKITKIDEKKLLYIFLLFSSNGKYITDTSIPPFLYMTFERISIDIMKIVYPNFKNEIFGTSTKKGEFFHGGLLINKLESLGKCLNTSLMEKAKNNPRYQHPSGDAGMDSVSYYRLDKEMCATFMLPVCIGQCTCSYYDWEDKQNSIDIDSLNKKYEDIVSYHEYIFVSFPLRGINGKWGSDVADRIKTIIIDRIRILNILHLNNKATILSDEITGYMKTVLGKIDVSV